MDNKLRGKLNRADVTRAKAEKREAKAAKQAAKVAARKAAGFLKIKGCPGRAPYVSARRLLSDA